MADLSTEQIHSELEKLEQNITLTLQSVDQNFAQCHHVVSTKILPQVEKYAQASKQIWDGSKYWLYFFQSLETSRAADGTEDNAEGAIHAPTPLSASSVQSRHNSLRVNNWDDDLSASPWERLKREMDSFSDLSSIAPATRVRANGDSSVERSSILRRANRSKMSNEPSHLGHVTTPGQLSPPPNDETFTLADLQPTERVAEASKADKQQDASLSIIRPPSTPHRSTTIDDDDFFNNLPYSPPRTMQFAIPQSMLLRTPAKQAAKSIVEDILKSAGEGNLKVYDEAMKSAQKQQSAKRRKQSAKENRRPPGTPIPPPPNSEQSRIPRSAVKRVTGDQSPSDNRSNADRSALVPTPSNYLARFAELEADDAEVERHLEMISKLSPFSVKTDVSANKSHASIKPEQYDTSFFEHGPNDESVTVALNQSTMSKTPGAPSRQASVQPHPSESINERPVMFLEDDETGVVGIGSPCPPANWLNQSPKSPFALVGSPTLHRVFDEANRDIRPMHRSSSKASSLDVSMVDQGMPRSENLTETFGTWQQVPEDGFSSDENM